MHDEAERPWRRPTWRDALASLAAAALAAFMVLPACARPTLQALGGAALVGPDLVSAELRLAGGLASPVALVVLALRLRRRDVRLSPDERYIVHAAAVMWTAVAGFVAWPGSPIGRLGRAILAGGAMSVALGPWLLAPSWSGGAWRGAKASVHSLVGGVCAVAVVFAVLAGIPGLVLRALGFQTAPTWLRPWFDVVAPLCAGAILGGSGWAAAAEHDGMPDRPDPGSGSGATRGPPAA